MISVHGQELVPVLPWSLGGEWLFRSVHKLPETTIPLDDLISKLRQGSGPVAFPSHVLRYPWLTELIEYCSQNPTRYSWQLPLGEEMFELWPNIKRVAAAGMNLELLTLQAPSDRIVRFLEGEPAAANAKLVFLPTALFNVEREIVKFPLEWRNRLRFSLIPKFKRTDPFLTPGEAARIREFVAVQFKNWRLQDACFHEYTGNGSHAATPAIRAKAGISSYIVHLPLMFLSLMLNLFMQPQRSSIRMYWVLVRIAHAVERVGIGSYWLVYRLILVLLWPIRKLYWFSKHQYQTRIKAGR